MIALYVRVSSAEQFEHGYSVGEQTARLKAYCVAKGWKNYKVYTDGGFSGATTDRPALSGLVKDVLNGDIEKVIVYKLDRLSRSQKDTLTLIEDIFLSHDVDFVSITENFDTSTPLGRAMIGILSVFAQLEREQIKERMSLGREGRAKQGKFHGGGNIPVGYTYENGALKINPYEAEQVKEIHKLYQSGLSVAQIVDYLNDKGYSHKFGAWSTSRVIGCITNNLYIGSIKYHDKVFAGKHEAIIDEETYARSMSIYNSRYKKHNNAKSSYLSGIVFCARCGARYGISAVKNHGKEYFYYCCYSRRKRNSAMVKNVKCKNKNYRRDDLDNMVLNEIKKLSLEPLEYKPKKTVNRVPMLQKEIEKLNSQKSRFLDLYGLGEFSIDDLKNKIVPLSEQIKKLESEIKEISEGQTKSAEHVKMIETFSDVLECGTYEQIKLIVHTLIDRVEIDGDDISIYWNF